MKSLPSVDDEISVGDTVYLEGVDLHGRVTAVYEANGEVEVQAGQLNLKVGLGSVKKVQMESGTVKRQTAAVRIPPAPLVRGELDLRGKRADEVEVALDGYLNDAALSNRNEVVIIHGVATGTVRQIVRLPPVTRSSQMEQIVKAHSHANAPKQPEGTKAGCQKLQLGPDVCRKPPAVAIRRQLRIRAIDALMQELDRHSRCDNPSRSDELSGDTSEQGLVVHPEVVI